VMHDDNELGRHCQHRNLVTNAARKVKLAPCTALFTVASLSHVGPANRSASLGEATW
jgi:hypothetical protein